MAKKRSTRRWVRQVTTDSTHPPRGTFTGSGQQIARTMARKEVSPRGRGSGIGLKQYFRNRAGKNLSAARFMKYWIIRMPAPRPLGETSLRAIVRAICWPEPVNVPRGGWVESVVTCLTHRRVDRFLAIGRTSLFDAVYADEPAIRFGLLLSSRIRQ